MKRLLVIAIVGGCTGSNHIEQDPYEQTLPSGPCAIEGVTGTIPGVTLAIRSDSCVYRRGQAARFRYDVAVDATAPAIDVLPTTSCGSCRVRTADPRSWITWSVAGTSSDGADQRYCLCDVGCCPPDRAATISLAVETVSEDLEWSGRNWGGPSDTGQPQGEPFPTGVYRVTVLFRGYERGMVTAELPVEIIP